LSRRWASEAMLMISGACPRWRRSSVAEHECPLRLDHPDDECVVVLWPHREDVAGLDLLKLRTDPLGAPDTAVVLTVVAVLASALASHLHKPGPDLSGASTDRDGVVPPDLGVRHQLITG
jgi:hypothetical protein